MIMQKKQLQNIKNQLIKQRKNKILLTNLHVKCNFKNTFISLTNPEGKVLKQWSTQSLKKTKLKKNNIYNIQYIFYLIRMFIKIKKIKKINIFFYGKGLARYNTLKNLKKKYIKIGYIFDKTYIPFNGCREKKKKRR